MKKRTFFIPGDRINPDVAPGRGYCIASDLITVAGHRVGFMYREEPDDRTGSGWWFFAGTEPQEYVDDPDNFTVYDVNTIANYDPDIIPFLDAAWGSAFERAPGSGAFRPAPFPDDADPET